MREKAQAGLEYLITYGWALVIIATIVGILVFTVSSPTEQPVFTSSDPSKLLLKGGSISGNTATIKLQNITGGEIKIIVISGGEGYSGCEATTGQDSVASGGDLTIVCNIAQGATQGTVAITFTDRQGLGQTVSVSGKSGSSSTTPVSPQLENTGILCSDSIDNDSDDLIDCADESCGGVLLPGNNVCQFGLETNCSDAFDNDADGKIDCADSDCSGNPACGSPLGTACSLGSECASGFCIDGVCCNSACAGACQACNLTKNKGTCTTGTSIGGGQCLGSELVVNGDFSSGENNWNFGDSFWAPGWRVAGGAAQYGPDGIIPDLTWFKQVPSLNPIAGRSYRLSYTVLQDDGPTTEWIGLGNQSFIPDVGSNQHDLTTSSTSELGIYVMPEGPSGITFRIDNISVKEKFSE